MSGTKPRWWRDEGWTPKDGSHHVEGLDAIWAPVACAEHSVQVELEDGFHEHQGDGHQPGCPSCAGAAEATRQHVLQVERNQR